MRIAGGFEQVYILNSLVHSQVFINFDNYINLGFARSTVCFEFIYFLFQDYLNNKLRKQKVYYSKIKNK